MTRFSFLILLPFLFSLLFLFLPLFSNSLMKRVAVGFSLLPLLLLLAFNTFDWLGEEIKLAWLTPLSIQFHLNMDSLSLLFTYLTAVIIPISLLALESNRLHSPRSFYSLVFLLQGLLFVFFSARDLVLFVIFWEAMLFPIYFIITLWGKEQARITALRFLIYMIAGSSLLVAGVLALYLASSTQGNGTFDLVKLAESTSRLPYTSLIFGIFALAFSVKTPLFPFHAWLPDTYYQASTSGTILLSALLSKAGIFGFLRIGLGLFPQQMIEWGPLLLGLSIAGVLYGGLAAWMQTDYKRLIAYSSFSHVNFILAGLFVASQVAHEGAILQAINHGITIAGLFLVSGWLEERLGTTQMKPFSGLAKYLPQLCWLTMIFVLSSVALPGTNNFIGELLILFGLFGQYPATTLILGLSVILSVIYMLHFMQHLYFQTPKAEIGHPLRDIRWKELLIAFPLVALIFWIGLYPSPVLKQVIIAEQNTTFEEGVEQ